MEHNVEFPPNQYWYCTLIITVLSMAVHCSIFLLVSMTFDRFYSIVRPHKASSFNTIGRTKTMIIIVVLFSIIFNIPHLFTSDHQGWQCIPHGKANINVYSQMYYWLSLLVQFVIPFVSLLSMNSVIIHKLRIRPLVADKEVESSEVSSRKHSDTQIFIMLLVVTFGFLVLFTPAYTLFLYVILVDVQASPEAFAGYYFFYHIAQKLSFSNHGVNFLFYVISGEKFRTDLRNLLRFPKHLQKKNTSHNKQISIASSQ